MLFRRVTPTHKDARCEVSSVRSRWLCGCLLILLLRTLVKIWVTHSVRSGCQGRQKSKRSEFACSSHQCSRTLTSRHPDCPSIRSIRALGAISFFLQVVLQPGACTLMSQVPSVSKKTSFR